MHDFFKSTAAIAAAKAFGEGFRDDPEGYRPPPEAILEYERRLGRPARKHEEEAWEAEWRRQLARLIYPEDFELVIDEVHAELPSGDYDDVVAFWEAVADEVERRTGRRPSREEVGRATYRDSLRRMPELLEERRRGKGRRNPRRRKTVKLSDTLASVFETDVLELAAYPDTFGLEGTEELVQLRAVASCLSEDGTRFVLPEDEAEAEVVWRALTDLSNDLDDMAESGRSNDPAFDRRAARGLGTLAAKVLKHARGRR
jgi:hypothetical protein